MLLPLRNNLEAAGVVIVAPVPETIGGGAVVNRWARRRYGDDSQRFYTRAVYEARARTTVVRGQLWLQARGAVEAVHAPVPVRIPAPVPIPVPHLLGHGVLMLRADGRLRFDTRLARRRRDERDLMDILFLTMS
jgi:hypothetical protein